jgi:histidinol-phosphate aminotransferase
MSLKFNPNIAASPIYTSGKSIEEVQQEFNLEEIIKIGSNESPLGPSPAVVEAIQQAAAGLNRYPNMGDEELRSALAQSIGQGIKPENFFTGNGGSDILAMIATGFLNPGDECIICRPTFPVYDLTARRRGAGVIYADLEPEHFSYDIEAILSAVTERTQIIYLCSPNNPTGNILTAQQMETLVNNLPSHTLVVTDEVYHHFVTDDDFADSLAYVRAGKNVVIIHSFSKAFGLAGLRLGYGIASPQVAVYLSRLRHPFHLDTLTFKAGLAGLQDTAYIEKTVELIVSGRQWLYDHLVEMGLKTWPSQANFILFKPPADANKVADQLLQHGVIVRPLAGFYMPEHIRVTVGLPEENRRFIAALGEVLG